MPLGERRVRQLTGAGLVVATLATRLPLGTKMLSEFDSVNFAVGSIRYSLEQVTPHFPGYILHILFAKFLLLFTSDVNRALVDISTLLSVGSVLYLWRAGVALRGGRVGLIGAAIWLVLPAFWYFGLVATAYEYEAFFASAMLYHGLRLLRKPENRGHLFAMAVMLSLAAGARQSSLVFFLPAFVYACVKTRQPARRIVEATGLFVLITFGWLGALFSMCGGASVYWRAMQSENIYRSQSVLFGNPVGEHLAIMAKVVTYLIASAFSFVMLAFYATIRYPKRLRTFIVEVQGTAAFRFVMLVALPPLLFYLLIYFMKGGYLLNVLPSLVLAAAVLIDQLAIWHAFDVKTAPGNAMLLTRPIITKSTIILASVVMALELCWFLIPFPGTSQAAFNTSFAYDAFGAPRSALPSHPGASEYVLNRVGAFTTLRAAEQGDVLHRTMLEALGADAEKGHLAILDTWWHRWEYYYLPQTFSFDIRDHAGEDSIAVGMSIGYLRTMHLPSEIPISAGTPVLLVIPHDHPYFDSIKKQVHLERLLLPEGLDVWRITDTTFSLHWKNRIFEKR